MSNSEVNSKQLIRLLFLGDPRFDRRVQNFLRFFVEKGRSIELFYGVPKGTDSFSLDGISSTKIELNYNSGYKRFLEYHRELFSLLKTATRADIVLSCDLYSLRAASMAKKNNLLIYDAREIYTQLPTVENKALSKFFWKWWERFALAKTNIVVTTAPLDYSALSKVHPSLPQGVVVKNMPSKLEQAIETISLHRHFGILEDKKIIVYVGGLQKDRGLEQLISAMTSLYQKAVLVLIGDGVLKESLQKIVVQKNLSESVFFYGFANVDLVVGLLQSASVGVSLIDRSSGSYALALPSKVFEYLHAGLVVVCSPLEQVRSSFSNNNFVLFADEHSPKEIEHSLRQSLLLSEDRIQREHTIKEARNTYVFEHDAEQLYKVLEQKLRQ